MLHIKCSVFYPSVISDTHTESTLNWSSGQPMGSSEKVRCPSQGHLSRGYEHGRAMCNQSPEQHFPLQPWIEPTTLQSQVKPNLLLKQATFKLTAFSSSVLLLCFRAADILHWCLLQLLTKQGEISSSNNQQTKSITTGIF